jgi:hypothetical protein
VDIVFARCAPGRKRLALREFVSALAALSDQAGRGLAVVAGAVGLVEREGGSPSAQRPGSRTGAAPDAADGASLGGLSTPGGGAGGAAVYGASGAGRSVVQSNPLYESAGLQHQPTPPARVDAGGALGALLARVEALEAAGARRQRQLLDIEAKQSRLAAEVQRLAAATGSECRSPEGPAARQLMGQVAELERAVEELKAAGGGGEAAAEAAARVERKVTERQARVESALMQVRVAGRWRAARRCGGRERPLSGQLCGLAPAAGSLSLTGTTPPATTAANPALQVARQVDVLDARLREEQDTSLKALEAILAGAASPAPRT